MAPSYNMLLASLLWPAFVLAQVPDLGPQLSQVISYKGVRYSECTDLFSTCPPTIASCATIACAQCTDLGDKPLNACCAQKSIGPETCIANAFGGGGGAAAGGGSSSGGGGSSAVATTDAGAGAGASATPAAVASSGQAQGTSSGSAAPTATKTGSASKAYTVWSLPIAGMVAVLLGA